MDDWKIVLEGHRAEFGSESFMRRYIRGERAYAELEAFVDAWRARAVSMKPWYGHDYTEIQLHVSEKLPEEAVDLVQDVIQHFGATIEQLSQALALHEQGNMTEPQRKSVTFPTAVSEPKGPVAGIQLLPAGAQKAILAMQPWAQMPGNPDGHVLAQLDDLSRRVRHRADVLTTSVSGLRRVVPNVTGGISEMEIRTARVDGIGQDVIMRWRNDSQISDVQASIDTHVLLNEPGSPSHGRDVVEILNVARQVIARTVFVDLLPYLR